MVYLNVLDLFVMGVGKRPFCKSWIVVGKYGRLA